MKKFIIVAATVLFSAVVGAYADKKYNLGIKDRVDGFADRLSKKVGKPSETTDNESASEEANQAS